MTLVLKTESHGEVDSGFFSGFTKLARIGDYAFETKDLCELVKYIAGNPELKELKIHAYPSDSFFKMRDRYINSFANLEDYTQKGIDEYIEGNQGKMSLKDKAGIIQDGMSLPVKIEEDAIKIGKYTIENFHFGLMAFYLARGGWCGWPDEKDKPDFSEPTIQAIRKSDSPVFKKAKEHFRFAPE